MKQTIRTMQAGFLLLFALAVLGCAQLGLQSPETVTEKIAAVQVARNQIGATTTALLNARKISSTDAENSLKVADAATDGIGLARTLAAQDPTAANARLTMIVTTLGAVQAYLALQQAKP